MDRDRLAAGVLALGLAAVGLRFALVGATASDEMTLVHDGLRTLRGEAIYRDFFQFTPPLTTWIAAAAQAVGGPGVLGPRLVQEAMLVVAAVALFGLARRLGTGPGLAAIAAAAPALALHRQMPVFNHHWLALAAGALALAAAGRALAGAGGWARAGAASALCLLAMQSDGLVITLAIAGGLALDAWRGGGGAAAIRAAGARFAGGFAATSALGWAPVVLSGGAAAAFDAIWRWPFRRYRTPGGVNDIAFGTDLHVNLSPFVEFWNLPAFYAKVAHFGLLFAVLVGGAVLALAWLAGQLGRRPGPWTPRRAAFGPVALAAIGLLLVATRGRADVIHVAANAWPGVLAWAAAAAALARRLPEAPLALVRHGPAAALAAFVAAGAVLWVGDMRRQPAAWALTTQPDAAIAASPAMAWLRARVRPGDALMAFPVGGYWGVYAGAPLVGRLTLILPPATGYLTPEEYAGFLAELAARRPRFVVFAPIGDLAADRPNYAPWPLPGYRLATTLDHPVYGGPRPAEIYERVAPP